jgi:hypothetical protein
MVRSQSVDFMEPDESQTESGWLLVIACQH